MRLIGRFENALEGKNFSNFLLTQGIENSCEMSPGECRIWVKEEDSVPAALHWFEKYKQSPNAPQFNPKRPPPLPQELPAKTELPFSKEPLGVINFLILLSCGLIFLLCQFTSPLRESAPSSVPPMPLFASPIKKDFLFDYPSAYAIIDQLIHTYGLEWLHDPSTLPKEGQKLLKQFEETPYWQGIYQRLLERSTAPFPPMFEKIREGEVWRFFTPIFLHVDIFHLIFNMIWLIVIGKQIEKRLGMARYLLFILLAALFSNTAQYLMSGPNFIGFSGVLCAMVVFVWMRQRRAPWEGYFMQPATWSFFVFFVFLMFAIQCFSFAVEASTGRAFSVNIANTAHLTGALVGYLLGRLNYFSAGYR
jgi:rhomboid protease GlpG